MCDIRHFLGMMLLIAALNGCTSTHTDSQPYQAGTAWPLDSLNYLYTDPVATSPADDNPIRWLAFLLNPIGVFLDYEINRPLYSLAESRPALYGFTPEDAALHSQRPNRSYGIQ